MSFMTNISNEIAKSIQSHIDLILTDKINRIKHQAREMGEVDLYRILSDLKMNNIEKTKAALESEGYELIMEHTREELVINETDLISVTIKPSDIKLSVKKTILKV